MRLLAVRMRNVRKFGSGGMAIENIPAGLSLLAAPNEFGKSTLFDGVRLALFEKHSVTKAYVKDMASVDGAAPQIEIDFHFEGKPYRLQKRFLKTPFAALIDLETNTTLKADGEAHDWMVDMLGAAKSGEGPAGLLWVEQGASMSPPNAGDSGKNLLADLLEREVGDVTGGDRARVLLKRVQTELGALITSTGRAKTGPYKSAIETLEVAQTELGEVQEKLAATDSFLTELTSIEQSIASLEDPSEIARISSDLDAAKARQAEAKQADQNLVGQKEKLQLRREAAKRREADFKDYSDLRAKAANLTEQIGKDEGRKNDLTETLRRLDEDLRALKETESAAAERSAQAEQLAKICAQAAREQDARKDQNTLRSAIEKADALTVKINEANGKLRNNLVTADRLQNIRAASQELATQDALLKAARPTLTAQLTDAGTAAVRLDEEPIDGIVQLSGQQLLSLGPLGSVVLETNDPKAAIALHEDAQSNLAGALKAAGVPSLKDAETAALNRTDLVRDIGDDTQELDGIAPEGIEVLREHYAALIATLGEGALSEEDIKSLPERAVADSDWEEAREAHNKARESRTLKGDERDTVADELRGLNASLPVRIGQQVAYVEKLGDPSGWDERSDKLEAEAREALAGVKTLADEIDRQAQEAPSLDDAKIDVERLEAATQTRLKTLSSKRERRAEITGELSGLTSQGLGETARELEEKIGSLTQKVAAFERKIAALQLLEKELSAAQAELQEAFLTPVSNELKPLLSMVLPDAQIALGDDFNAELVHRGGRQETIGSLSGGTQEQIAVLTRLAFAQLMAKRGRNMPVVLDDALVWCDDARLESVFRALHAAAKDIQCLVLTCHERGFATLGAPMLDVKSWPETG